MVNGTKTSLRALTSGAVTCEICRGDSAVAHLFDSNNESDVCVMRCNSLSRCMTIRVSPGTMAHRRTMPRTADSAQEVRRPLVSLLAATVIYRLFSKLDFLVFPSFLSATRFAARDTGAGVEVPITLTAIAYGCN